MEGGHLPGSAVFTAPLTKRALRELSRLAAKPDSEIDFSDAPEPGRKRPRVVVGRFYRPLKQPISLRLDADVLAWFRQHGPGYQSYMNEVLRREAEARRTRES